VLDPDKHRLLLLLLLRLLLGCGGCGGGRGGELAAAGSAAAAAVTLGGGDRSAASSDGGEVDGVRGVRVRGGERVAARGRARESRRDDGERDGVEGCAELVEGAQGEHLASLDPGARA